MILFNKVKAKHDKYVIRTTQIDTRTRHCKITSSLKLNKGANTDKVLALGVLKRHPTENGWRFSTSAYTCEMIENFPNSAQYTVVINCHMDNVDEVDRIHPDIMKWIRATFTRLAKDQQLYELGKKLNYKKS